jgi:cytochrome c oxidase subunit 4
MEQHNYDITEEDPRHHVTSLAVYLTVFGALMVLTAITVVVAQFDFGLLNTPIALGIASVKAALVILYFMHVRHSSKLTWVVIIASFAMVAVLFVLTFADYLSRSFSTM